MNVLNLKAPFQTLFTIKTNCNHLVDMLYLKYGKYIFQAKTCENNIISATKNDKKFGNNIKKARDEYFVEYNGNICKTQYPLLEIDRILFKNTHYDEDIFAMHGAAVEFNNKAYVFLAATTSGKTTLASFLSGNGFGYITDDCILLDKNDLHIYPYSTPIHLRQGGLRVLKKLGCVPKDLRHLDDEMINRYIYTPINSITPPIPLAKIFFIQRNDNINKTEKITTTDAMVKLMKSPITEYAVTGEYVKFISRLSQIGCYDLLYKDMSYAAEVIKNE